MSIDEGSFEPSGSPSDGVSRPLLARKACSRIQPNFQGPLAWTEIAAMVAGCHLVPGLSYFYQ